jgi:hypothetical protein
MFPQQRTYTQQEFLLETVFSTRSVQRGLYVCMYKVLAMKSGPSTMTFNDLLCFPFN